MESCMKPEMSALINSLLVITGNLTRLWVYLLRIKDT